MIVFKRTNPAYQQCRLRSSRCSGLSLGLGLLFFLLPMQEAGAQHADSNYWSATLGQCRSFLNKNIAVAESACKSALQTAEKTGETEQLVVSLVAMADVHDAKLELRESISAITRAYKLIEERYGPQDARVTVLVDRVARLYLRVGLPKQAIVLWSETLVRSRAERAAPFKLAANLNNLALAYLDDKQFDKSALLFGEARNLLIQNHGNPRNIATLTLNLGHLALRQSQYRDAETLFREGMALEEKRQGGHSSQEKGYLLLGLGRCLRLQGRTVEAEEVLRKAVIIVRNEMGMSHIDYAEALQELGETLALLSKEEEARDLLNQARQIRVRFESAL